MTASSITAAGRGSPILEAAQDVSDFLTSKAAPVLDVIVRLWLAQSFLASGLLKTVQWPATVFLYTAEHPIPGMAPEVAAWVGTTIEIVCPLLLMAGLATRAAALPLLATAAFLYVTYNPLDTHVFQMLLLALLAARGSGPLSVDAALAPHLAGSALPFAARWSELSATLQRWFVPPTEVAVRLLVSAQFLTPVAGWIGSGAAPFVLAGLAIAGLGAALSLGLGTRLVALSLLCTIPFGGLPTMGDEASGLLCLLLLGFVCRGGGALTLDRPLMAHLLRRFPGLAADAGWLADAPRVVIVGAGFGGIAAARGLKRARARVTIIDRRNYHLFQPLLYQVATASLSPADIATPIRTLVRNQANCQVIMGRVTAIDTARRQVIAGSHRLGYEYLILATGARHSYFGKDEWEGLAPGLKKIDDATAMRGRILSAFERAETCEDADERRRLLTFVIVGGGPTGVELAGAIAELARHGLRGEFRLIDPSSTRVILVQSAPRLLPAMPEALGLAAEQSLRTLGVEVLTGAKVQMIDADGVQVGAMRIAAATVLWAAGVMASAAGRWIGAARDGSGRVVVGPDLSVPGLTGVFALGDTAACLGPDGSPLPGLAAVAKQQGGYIARLIRARLEDRPAPKPFRYRNWGSMATIGRKAAVADLRGLRLSGSIAWWLWSAVHVGFLVDARSRLAVLLDWFWSYLTYSRGMRLITGNEGGVD